MDGEAQGSGERAAEPAVKTAGSAKKLKVWR